MNASAKRAASVPWTPDDEQRLIERYPDIKTGRLLEMFPGRTITQLYRKAHALGLKKSPAFFSSGDTGRTDGRVGSSTRFRKGMRPWNKGMKGLDMGGKETRFKPGQRPHTWLPVGSERITRDGILQRKMTDTGYTPRDWVPVHVLLWQELHGPIPEGSIVVFKDGNRRNIVPENLECITRRENMQRNTVHNLPPEMVEVIHLRGALNRKINRRMRENP